MFWKTMCYLFYQDQKGQSLIEALLVIAVMAIIIPGLFVGIFASREGRVQQASQFQALTLLKEAQEALRNVREYNWNQFAVDGVFHPIASGSAWSLANGSETINGFTRQITINDVYRATASGVIVSSPSLGYLDPSTKLATTTISSTTSATLTSTVYLTRYLDNASWLQTTQADFNTGSNSATTVTNTAGGEVTLGAGGGGGDWCVPSFAITTVNLSRQGVPTSIGAYPGNIVTGTGGNASGPTFVKTTVSGNSPPNATIVGQFNNSKANQVFTETSYGYIATTSHSQEVQILDLSSTSGSPPSYSLVGWFDAPGNGNGNSVFASGTVGYMTSGNKFYTFDLTSHSGSRSQLNPTAVTLAGTGNKVIVVGNYAFVAINSTTTQLQIINVTDPKNPSIVASATTGNSQNGVDVSVNSTGTRAYLITGYAGASTPDVFIINTSTKSGSLPLIGSGYNTGGMSPQGVSVATGNRVIVVGTGGSIQYQVINIANETSPVSCGTGLTIPNGAYAVATVLQNDGYAYAYVVTGDTNAELKIILGGAGGTFVTSGTYESAPFSPTVIPTVFNRFLATVSVPNQTTLQMQIAVANKVAGSCTNANYTYLGPNGSPGAYFTIGTDPTQITGTIPIITVGNYTNPGACVKYKAYFTSSDSSATPVLYDMTVNYSP